MRGLHFFHRKMEDPGRYALILSDGKNEYTVVGEVFKDYNAPTKSFRWAHSADPEIYWPTRYLASIDLCRAAFSLPALYSHLGRVKNLKTPVAKEQ